MTDPLVPVGDGHTVISDEDHEGLILTYIVMRDELFAAEETNLAPPPTGFTPRSKSWVRRGWPRVGGPPPWCV